MASERHYVVGPRDGGWVWEEFSSNGQKTADSADFEGDTYTSKAHARRAVLARDPDAKITYSDSGDVENGSGPDEQPSDEGEPPVAKTEIDPRVINENASTAGVKYLTDDGQLTPEGEALQARYESFDVDARGEGSSEAADAQKLRDAERELEAAQARLDSVKDEVEAAEKAREDAGAKMSAAMADDADGQKSSGRGSVAAKK
jgi:hypothetical protein